MPLSQVAELAWYTAEARSSEEALINGSQQVVLVPGVILSVVRSGGTVMSEPQLLFHHKARFQCVHVMDTSIRWSVSRRIEQVCVVIFQRRRQCNHADDDRGPDRVNLGIVKQDVGGSYD